MTRPGCGLLILSILMGNAVAAPAASIPEIDGFHILTGAGGPWPTLLRSYGLPEQGADARVIVLPQGPVPAGDWRLQAENGKILILEGDSPLARRLGIQPTSRKALVSDVQDAHAPELEITWEDALTVPVYSVPKEARIIESSRAGGAPLMVTLSLGRGGVLWIAVSPGEQGYERFPFLLQTLSELGVQPDFESRRLWAFYDSAYQRDQKPDELARSWRAMGIASIHVSAWNFFEPHPDEDLRLQALIEACHREGILVYAWLELPHVSVEFWNRHPEWREKTALFKDAAVDWRLLMNLVNPQCRQAVAEGVRGTLRRFDWDGVNLAEMYFDGVNGIKLPEEFTPLNDDVRQEVRRLYGFDPAQLFDGSPRDPVKVRQFLNYRADLAARMQEMWIDELEKARAERPHLDIVLTHVDDRFDTSMRDAIGADAARLLKQLDKHDLTFIVEDPETIWSLGPDRYSEIARRYRPLTDRFDHVGVDINLVDREDAYPTSAQTGAEMAELIHTASESFTTVIFYYTASISPLDAPLLAPASSVVTHCKSTGGSLQIESPYGVGVRWPGPVLLDGKPWPVRDREHVWVPAGKHILRPAETDDFLKISDFTGNLERAAVLSDGIEIVYTSQSRAFAKLSAKPARIIVDGEDAKIEFTGESVIQLPRGRHTVRIFAVPQAQ